MDVVSARHGGPDRSAGLKLIQTYRAIADEGVPVAFGSDLNGFVTMTGPRFGPEACPDAPPGEREAQAAQQVAPPAEGRPERFAIYAQRGVADIGTLPSLLHDMRFLGAGTTSLDNSAEAFLRGEAARGSRHRAGHRRRGDGSGVHRQTLLQGGGEPRQGSAVRETTVAGTETHREAHTAVPDARHRRSRQGLRQGRRAAERPPPQRRKGSTMSADEVILAALDAFAAGDRAGWEAAMARDVVYWEPCTGRRLMGTTQVADAVFLWKASWPDLRHSDTTTITQGEQVCVETVWLGTQTGPLYTPDGQTLPATGRQTVNPAAMVVSVRDGRVASMHHYFDLANIMRALGLVE